MSLVHNFQSIFAQLKDRSKDECDKNEFLKRIPDNGRYETTGYTVTCDDGYILQLFRVRLVEAEKNKLPENLKKNINRPVLIHHGISCDSTCMVPGEKNGFSFHLINEGFDCWFGNSRGTKFSMGHINPNLSDKDYYNFSFQEMGWYDMPGNYKTILSEYPDDKNKKIIYFGHSQGSSAMFVALSDAKTKDFMR